MTYSVECASAWNETVDNVSDARAIASNIAKENPRATVYIYRVTAAAKRTLVQVVRS